GDARGTPLDARGEVERRARPRVPVPPAGDEAPATDLTPVPAAWSEEELLREKDFGDYTEAERAVARRLLAQLALRGPRRQSRRTLPPRPPPAQPALRPTTPPSLRPAPQPF